MKHQLACLVLSLQSFALSAPDDTKTPPQAVAEKARKPNVIVILTDDLGYGDTNCYGAKPEHVKTPNIDRLAKPMRFTDAHSPAAVCTPSRYSLLTGEYAFRNKKEWGVLPGDAPLGFQPGSYTMPEMFRTTGYATGFVGKWHLGLGDGKAATDWNGEIKPGPLEVGFTSAFFMPATGDRVPTVYVRDHRVENLDPADPIQVNYKQKIGAWPTGTDNPDQADVLCGAKGAGHQGTITAGVSRMGWMTGGKAALWNDEKLMDRLTGEAVQFITKNREKPFFLYFATHGIHEPRVPAKRFAGKSGAGVYGDQIEELDDSVSRILQTLDDLKLSENTLIVFSSDNGGSPQQSRPIGDMDAYHYGARTSLNGHIPNGVLRGGKYNAFEGGTRVPFIVRWKGHIDAGTTSPALLSHTDLQSSFARLLGVTLPAGAAPDSMDVLDALVGKSKAGRRELIEQQSGPNCALRVDQWKWINGQLYDLSNDLSETRDLAKEQPDRVKAMAARLDELRAAKQTRP